MPVLLETAARDFLASRTRDGLSPRSIETYTYVLRPLIREFYGSRIGLLTATDIQHFLAGMRTQRTRYRSALEERGRTGRPVEPGSLSIETMRSRIRQLKVFFNWCWQAYDLPPETNPMRKIRMPRAPQPEPKAISLEGIRRLIAATGDDVYGIRDRAILFFLADTGCRAGGLLGLRLDDLDLDRRRAILHEKGDRVRPVPFSPDTAEVLRQWLAVRPQDAETLFCALGNRPASVARGEPLTESGLYLILKRLARRAGLEERFNPHSFRHAFAREVLRLGADLATVAQYLGHTSVLVTARHYARWAEDELRERHDKFSPIRHLKGGENGE